MGKNKRQKLGPVASHKKHSKLQSKPSKFQSKPRPSISSKTSTPTSKPTTTLPSKTKPHIQVQHSKPIIPFSPTDNILLIGEGDLSFAASLVKHHGCKNVSATVLEGSREELVGKYEGVDVEGNLGVVVGGSGGLGGVGFGVDVGRKGGLKGKLGAKGWVGKEREFMVKDHGEARGCMDRVVFNFPHVGGRCKDVNRQVRYNQELLVSFFHATTPLLSPRPGSSIIVTLFEGEPYTLWNIRDLARHSGLQVQRSFRFQADAYPGYRHARTLGSVRRKGDGGVSERAWKGEEREARSYVFVRRGEEGAGSLGGGTGKRKRGLGSDDESESESEEEEEVGGGGGQEFVGDTSDFEEFGAEDDEVDDHAGDAEDEDEKEEQSESKNEGPR